jgi:hypothetical protein
MAAKQLLTTPVRPPVLAVGRRRRRLPLHEKGPRSAERARQNLVGLENRKEAYPRLSGVFDRVASQGAGGVKF